jgi:hypothetical protein
MWIYIASSWKNETAVRMLTAWLEENGHRVLSFVENNHGEQKGHAVTEDGEEIPFEKWVWSSRGHCSLLFDVGAAMTVDLVIYLSPSGTDAWAEVGAAFAAGVPVVGIYAKGEQSGLMRRMVTWMTLVELQTLLEYGSSDAWNWLTATCKIGRDLRSRCCKFAVQKMGEEEKEEAIHHGDTEAQRKD